MRLVLIVADSLRADDVGGPTLGALAREGTRFTQACCSGSWTIPSLASMVTGRFPHRLGVCHWDHLPPPGTPSLLALAPRVTLAVPNPRAAFRCWPGARRVVDSQDVPAVAAAIREQGEGLVLVHHWFTHFPYLTRPLSWGGGAGKPGSWPWRRCTATRRPWHRASATSTTARRRT